MLMKKIATCTILINISIILNAQDGVSIGRSAPDPSAVLHVDAPESNKGMLIPRLTQLQRNNIATPADGLIIYNINREAFNYYDGSNWVQLIPTPAKFNVNMAGNRIVNIADGVDTRDAVSKGQVDDVDANNLDVDGSDSMIGNLNMGNRRIVNLSNGVATNEAITLGQLNNLESDIESLVNSRFFKVDYSLSGGSMGPVFATANFRAPKTANYLLTSTIVINAVAPSEIRLTYFAGTARRVATIDTGITVFSHSVVASITEGVNFSITYFAETSNSFWQDNLNGSNNTNNLAVVILD